MPKTGMEWVRRQAPEILLALLAVAIFLGCLGSVDLWGKREQRASAEAIDTIDQGHWLVAMIQGRPRLEKPPLPRWTVAALMVVTGQRSEWIVRLPGALSALGMVALVYGLGRRMGGHSVGLAAGFALSSFGTFIIEQRQAGNDGPLAFFTTLALYAAWRRLHGGQNDGETLAPAERPGAWAWTLLFYAAMGLGFLTKGPVVVMLVILAVLPYLAITRRFRSGGRLLVSGWGLALFVLLALSWPVPVLLHDPNAARVWYLEMAQKAGSAGVKHHHSREILAADWFGMTAPWSIVATLGALVPLWKRGRLIPPSVWFAWTWAMLNLLVFCFWKVAKPNYYLPCLPAAALLTGFEWNRLVRLARTSDLLAVRARRVLQIQWVTLFVAALVAPVIIGQIAPVHLGWALVLSSLLATAVVSSVVLVASRGRRPGHGAAGRGVGYRGAGPLWKDRSVG